MKRSGCKGEVRRYYASLLAFLLCLGLLLLALVDMRRGILFSPSTYTKVGSPSVLLYFEPRHLLPLLAGSIGAWCSYRYMAKRERGLKDSMNLSRLADLLAIALIIMLVTDLFTYRIVPAGRIVGAGKIGVGQALPLSDIPAWLQPLGEAANYFVLVWHATLLGILAGALMLLLVLRFLRPALGGDGFRAHVAGAALAVPYPFCSCCASPIGATLYRGGASLGPTLAFVVSSPMLNVTSLALAVSLLPARFALLRILGGLVVGILITHVVAVIASRWIPSSSRDRAKRHPLGEVSSRLLDGYGRLFRFEEFLRGKAPDSPGALTSIWLALSWRLARVAVPALFLGALVAAAIMEALPSYSDNAAGVVVAAGFGTILMIPTWTEVAIAGPLIKEGLEGPAAALLVALPAVSLPCLAIMGAALSSYRAALLLGLMVFVAATVAGLLYLSL